MKEPLDSIKISEIIEEENDDFSTKNSQKINKKSTKIESKSNII